MTECENAITSSANYCMDAPSYPHTLFTEGTPTMPEQTWQNTSSSDPCYYTCDTHYTWHGSSCDADTQKITNCT
jgi:hypothetical protein